MKTLKIKFKRFVKLVKKYNLPSGAYYAIHR